MTPSNVVSLFGHLGAAPANDPLAYALGGKVIKGGAPKDVVLGLQQLLASYGFSPGSVDGLYGRNTMAAVQALQRKLGVAADGLFGPGTARAIQADLGKGAGSVLRNQTPMQIPDNEVSTAQPTTTAIVPRGVEVQGGGLPATQPAQAKFGWGWLFLGAAGVFALWALSKQRAGEEQADPYVPPGSVVADLGDDDGEDFEDEFEETEET